MDVRVLVDDERAWMAAQLAESWGDTLVIARGERIDASALPGLVAVGPGDERVGLLTYRLGPGGLEVVTINAFERRRGVGSALLARAARLARDEGLGRLWLVTTNGNLGALVFYLRRGLRIVAVHQNAVCWSRQVKSSIPAESEEGVPFDDELELELLI